jgi:hypothetical protein
MVTCQMAVRQEVMPPCSVWTNIQSLSPVMQGKRQLRVWPGNQQTLPQQGLRDQWLPNWVGALMST